MTAAEITNQIRHLPEGGEWLKRTGEGEWDYVTVYKRGAMEVVRRLAA